LISDFYSISNKVDAFGRFHLNFSSVIVHRFGLLLGNL
jgi:hypothetical protein